MKPRAFPYYTVMVDHGGRLGYEAIVHPEMTRQNVIDFVASDEGKKVVFIQYVTPDDKPEDVTEEIMEAAGRLHEDVPSISPADRLACQHDHERDLRKHVGAV